MPKVESSIKNNEESKDPKDKLTITKPKSSTSGLSLKSIRQKREHSFKQKDEFVDTSKLPQNPVNQSDLEFEWNAYAKDLEKKGKKIISSILQMEVPKINGDTIELTFSNSTSKIELERAQNPLLAYLKPKLKNYNLHLNINVKEELSQKYAFTPREKYMKLAEKNSNLELLKKTFGLDI